MYHTSLISKPSQQKGLLIIILILSITQIQQIAAQQNNTSQFLSENSQQVTFSNEQVYEKTPTQKQREGQAKNMTQFYQNSDDAGLNSQFSFQITQSYEQFHFHLPTDLVIRLKAKVYVLKNNAYSPILNIQQQSAVYLIVYENNHRIIAEKSFYFTAGITIRGKAGSTYMIRFFSSNKKLITVTHSSFIQTLHFEQKVKTSQIQQNQLKLQTLTNRLQQIFKQLRFTHGTERAQRIYMTIRTENFVRFEFLQIIILAAVCIFQVKMVSKLFKTQSIV